MTRTKGSAVLKRERIDWRESEHFFGLGPTLTEEQKVFVDSIFANQLTIVNAPSGTGKTTIPVAVARLLGMQLVYVFFPVEENKMGFTPGTQAEKEFKYLQPLFDALMEIDEDPQRAVFNPDTEDKFSNRDAWVFPRSHVFMRGINLRDKFVLIDEAQNGTRLELKKILSRMHDSTKVVLVGHTGQCDIPPRNSGFERAIEVYSGKDYASVCSLSKNFRGRLATDADEI